MFQDTPKNMGVGNLGQLGGYLSSCLILLSYYGFFHILQPQKHYL